jgi:hypothetical protein
MGWIYIGVAIVALAYAALLNNKRVHDWYTPDWTWITVVIGDGIILAGLWAAALIGYVPWHAWWAAFWLTCAAGGPIITWQLIRAAKRRRRATQALWRG